MAVEAGYVPGCSASHFLLGHVNCLATSWANVSASPTILGNGLHSAILRCHVCLSCCRNVAGWWSIPVLVASVHGEHPSTTATIAVTLGAKQLAVAGAAVDVPFMLGQVAAVQAPMAVSIGTGEALDVPVLADGNLLLIEVYGRVAPRADARHVVVF